ncbi:macro domain-containing protein [Miltoncostaea oceani]|uniref:macro domain-containing protein n=1 Tax=Miltoncostaea oceani TaxID=2843216 RepID=UPI001C3DD23E|nr:macro domain-containing protein [Miltoncostaea oceani]
MTFTPRQGDLLADHATALVCPTNTVGVMGAGLARQFRDRFPGLEADYRKACRAGVHTPAQPFIWGTGEQTVLCLATKRHFRDPSRVEDVQSALTALAAWMGAQQEPVSVAISAIGCGLGGLSWIRQVRPLIEPALCDVPGELRVYAPWAPG